MQFKITHYSKSNKKKNGFSDFSYERIQAEESKTYTFR